MNRPLDSVSVRGPSTLTARRIAMLVTHGVELDELVRAESALRSAGATCVRVGPIPGSVTAMRQLEHAADVRVAAPLDSVVAEDFDGLYVSGGAFHADALRASRRAIALVEMFVSQRKPVAAVGHAAALLIEARAVRGARVASAPTLATDLANAGAQFLDCDVLVDRGLLTGRGVPAFYAALREHFEAKPSASGTRWTDLIGRLLPNTASTPSDARA
ncbi:MAG: DJ-1/PfpI family protein [Polyangiaceae bacterium]